MKYEEDKIQIAIVEYLEMALSDEWTVVHAANKPRSARAGAREKKMGAKAGFPDLMLIGPSHGDDFFVGFIEVKSGDGRLSKAQKDMHERLQFGGREVAVCRSIEDVRETLYLWGISTREPGGRWIA